MSDIEEPPTKLSKLSADMEHNISVGSADNGQEEWLSEDVMTDDEYNPVSQTMQEQELALEQANDSQPSTTDSMEVERLDDTGNTDGQYGHETTEHLQTNYGLEAAGLQLDHEGTVPQQTDNGDQIKQELFQAVQDLPVNTGGQANAELKSEAASLSQLEDDIGMFLLRRGAGDAGDAADEGDGNNTDDLLSMLGEGSRDADTQPAPAARTSDDDNVFDSATITTLKVAKNARLKKLPVKKAVAEESESDMSSDEAAMVQQMFRLNRKKPVAKNNAKSSAEPTETRPVSLLKASQPTKTSSSQRYTQNTSSSKSGAQTKPQVANVSVKSASTPFRQYVNKKLATPTAFKQSPAAPRSEPDSRRPENPPKQPSFAPPQQRLMRPEEMDEELPTDEDSNASEGSFYDELPSSESEDIEDWFALDIRAERAGDYIPLLGHKACSLLTDEKRRVADRLLSLRSGLSTLSAQSRAQTRQIDDARRTLAELDAQLMHA